MSASSRAAPSGRAAAPALAALVEGARGRVALARRGVVVLRLERGPLVALLPTATPLHPWALASAGSGPPPAEEAPLLVSGGELRCGSLRVPLAGLERVDLGVRRRPSRRLPQGLAGSLRPEPRDDPFSLQLEAELAAFAVGGDPAPLAGLVGLGAGLTPSGDDALVGVLAALDWSRRACPAAAALRARLASVLASRTPRDTPQLSAQLLASAAAGLYAEPVLALLDALWRHPPETAAVHAARRALLAVGHHSGADLLSGIAAALQRLTGTAATRRRQDAAARRGEGPTGGPRDPQKRLRVSPLGCARVALDRPRAAVRAPDAVAGAVAPGAETEALAGSTPLRPEALAAKRRREPAGLPQSQSPLAAEDPSRGRSRSRNCPRSAPRLPRQPRGMR